MSNRASNRKKCHQTNAACLLGALLVAGVLTPSFSPKSREDSPEERAILALTEPALREAPQAIFPSKFRGKRDPWANPIISCSLVAPSDFGYDQKKIYRLPSELQETSGVKKSRLRDPMANLLLKTVDSHTSTS